MNKHSYHKEIYSRKHEKNGRPAGGRYHFDVPLPLNAAYKLVTNPRKISRHAFLPFISFDQKVRRLKKFRGTFTKAKSKIRPLKYASYKDGYIYTYYSHILGHKYEELVHSLGLNSSILAYRSLGKSNVHMAQEAFDWIKAQKNCTAIALDLSSFFETIDHRNLKSQWAKILNEENLPEDHYKVFKSMTRYSYLDLQETLDALGWLDASGELREILSPKTNKLEKNTPFPLRKLGNSTDLAIKDFRDLRKNNPDLLNINKNAFGIPQGSPISALLSNISMIDFDVACQEMVSAENGIYRRYSDDILLLFPAKIDHQEIIAETDKLLHKFGGKALKLNTDKTEVRFFTIQEEIPSCIDANTKESDSLQYLGFEFNGESIFIRSSSLSRYWRKVISKVNAAKNRAHKKTKECGIETPVYKRKIYRQFTHLGVRQRNFVKYAFESSKIMGSKDIRNQVSNHWNRIQKEFNLPRRADRK